jgi:polyphosphate kinase
VDALLFRGGDWAMTVTALPPECCGEGSDGVHDSLLEFNAHVLVLAAAPETPVLERARFLAILSHNLDEFFTVRVAELKLRVADEHAGTGEDGESPFDWADPTMHIDLARAAAAAERAAALLKAARRYFQTSVAPELARAGIRLLTWDALSERGRAMASAAYSAAVLPTVDGERLLVPHLASLSRSVVVASVGEEPAWFAVVPVARTLPRFVATGDGWVAIEELVAAQVDASRVGYVMRVTRAADERSWAAHGESGGVSGAESLVMRRGLAPVVRLEVDARMPAALREALVGYFRGESAAARTLGDAEVHEIDPPPTTSLDALDQIANMARPELSYPDIPRRDPVGGAPWYEAIAAGDVMAHYPYDDFDAVTRRFFLEAAADPAVRRVQATLYRTDSRSPVVDALMRASRAGKEVTVLVELMARFDETWNVHFTRILEAVGCRVIHAPRGLKVHGKVALVDRDDRPYGFVSTGNLNAVTGRLYTDFALVSARAELCDELRRLFGELREGEVGTGYSHLVVSPREMRDRFLALIAGEAARIRVKLNGLDDPAIIAALYAAAERGVRVDMVVRGLCTLRPREGIRVVSLVGRFLEHGRIYAFGDGDETRYWIGSADWRARNLSRRVEVAVPVVEASARARLGWTLDAELADPTAWVLRGDGSYVRATDDGVPPGPSTQDQLIAALR